jgi:hypothetical protein
MGKSQIRHLAGQVRLRTRRLETTMKNMWKLLTTVLIIAALVGCQKIEPTPAASAGTNTSVDVSAAISPAGTQRGLDDITRLALGTLNLEDTEDAVSPAQAAEMLPLWQVIQSGSLKSNAETQAVLKQVEAKMTESQLAAIEAMGLTFEDVQTWMQKQGIEMPARPEGQQGGPGSFGDLSEDERAQMREQFQTPGDVSPEERATRMAEMGMQRPEGAEGRQGGAPGGGRQANVLLEPLIQLLSERSG